MTLKLRDVATETLGPEMSARLRGVQFARVQNSFEFLLSLEMFTAYIGVHGKVEV